MRFLLDTHIVLMIAQAKAEEMFFLTHDALLSGYGEKCVILL